MYQSFFIFSQICDRTEGVCACVCVSSLQLIRVGRFWWNFPQMILKIFASDFFTDFENSKWMTSWRPFYMFFIAALSQSQFCFNFLQNWAQGTKLSSNVCYWKSAKSVGSFRKYRQPRFQKNQNWHQKLFFFQIGQVRYRFPLIQTRWSRIW